MCKYQHQRHRIQTILTSTVQQCAPTTLLPSPQHANNLKIRKRNKEQMKLLPFTVHVLTEFFIFFSGNWLWFSGYGRVGTDKGLLFGGVTGVNRCG